MFVLRLVVGLIPVVLEHPGIALDGEEPEGHTDLKRRLGWHLLSEHHLYGRPCRLIRSATGFTVFCEGL
jgi:hypothetical protein